MGALLGLSLPSLFPPTPNPRWAAELGHDEELALILPTPPDAETFARCDPETPLEVGRARMLDLFEQAPNGLERGGWFGEPSPAYHFFMRLLHDDPQPFAGGCNLRLADTENVRRYIGHVGYHVFPPCRGRRYAARSVKLLLPLARRHGIDPLVITANPENAASRRSIEHAGGRFVEIVDLPRNHPLRRVGECQKARYELRT